MAKVYPRTWTTPSGEKRKAFMLSYMGDSGVRHRKQFARKKDAEDERVRVEGLLASGLHISDKDSLTVLGAAQKFIADFQILVAAGKRERSTLSAYETQIDLHLKPYAIASKKLSRLNGPDCTSYARGLEEALSDAMSTRVFALLRQILKFAQSNGWIATQPAASVSIRTAGDRSNAEEVIIPPKDQLKALCQAAKEYDNTGQALAMVGILMFGGLRASELRGLPRKDLFLNDGKIRISQRADQWQTLGAVKTKNSRRLVKIPPMVIDAIKQWLKVAPPSKMGLVFPTGVGTVESYANIYHRIWIPLMAKAGLVDGAPDEDAANKDGAESNRPWFALHTLRHVACSLWIEQGATPKQVTTWAGHYSIQFTMDRYGHLWSDDIADSAIASAAQNSIMG